MFELTDPKQLEAAKALLNRFLKTSPYVDLWKFYIVYVRSVQIYCKMDMFKPSIQGD